MSKQFWRYALIGAVLVGVWYYYHTSCPACQKKFAMWKNRIGSNMIEPKPRGTIRDSSTRTF